MWSFGGLSKADVTVILLKLYTLAKFFSLCLLYSTSRTTI